MVMNELKAMGVVVGFFFAIFLITLGLPRC